MSIKGNGVLIGSGQQWVGRVLTRGEHLGGLLWGHQCASNPL